MRIIGIILALFTAMHLHAQMQGEEIVEGKVYIVHKVEQGNTLFGLQRIYNVSVETIVMANPGAEDGLKLGQKILIPTGRMAELPSQDSSPKKHTVMSGETLFGISRKYNCSVDELLVLNPAAEEGIKVGQELFIPDGEISARPSRPLMEERIEEQPRHKPTTVYKPTNDDSIVKYTVQPGETLYSISRRYMVDVDAIVKVNNIVNNRIAPGDELIIPLKREREADVTIKPIDSVRESAVSHSSFFGTKEKYVVSVLLPFKLNANNAIVANIIDENTRLNSVSEIAVDFYMGVKLALDSLKKLGFNADVYVFDTDGSESVVEQLLQRDELMRSDVVFGPIFPKSIEVAATWAKKNGKRIVFPTAVSTHVLKGNPYAHAMVPSDLTLINGMAAYLAQDHWDDNIVIVETGKADEKDRIESFLMAYTQNVPKGKIARTIRRTSLGSASGKDLARYFELDTLSVFVCLTDNVQGVMQFTNTLNAAKNSSSKHGQANVIAVGTRAWMNIEALNSYYRNRFKLHYASTTKSDFRNAEFNKFQRVFRKKYHSDASRYAIQGFDVVFFYCAANMLERPKNGSVLNDFQLTQVGGSNGWENRSTFIIKQDDFDLYLMKTINKPSAGNEE